MSGKKAHSVLVIDDNQDYLEIIKLGLSKEFNILTCEDFHSLKEDIYGMKPSIIMIDRGLREAGPDDLIDYIQTHTLFKEIPIYLVSENELEKNHQSESDYEDFKVKPHYYPLRHFPLIRSNLLPGRSSLRN